MIPVGAIVAIKVLLIIKFCTDAWTSLFSDDVYGSFTAKTLIVIVFWNINLGWAITFLILGCVFGIIDIIKALQNI